MQTTTTGTVTQQIVTQNNNQINIPEINDNLLNLQQALRQDIQQYALTDIDSNSRLLRTINSITNSENIDISSIDSATILEINNSTTSSRRTEFLNNILNYNNYQANLNFLIDNSNENVLSYIRFIVMDIVNVTGPLNEELFFPLGNILAYSLANFEAGDLTLRLLLQSLRFALSQHTINHDIFQMHLITSNFQEVISNLGLLHQNAISQQVQLFQEGIEENHQQQANYRASLNRRSLLMLAGTVAGTSAFSLFCLANGIPNIPYLNTILNSVNTEQNNDISTSISANNNIRLRDIFDKILKIIYKKI